MVWGMGMAELFWTVRRLALRLQPECCGAGAGMGEARRTAPGHRCEGGAEVSLEREGVGSVY